MKEREFSSIEIISVLRFIYTFLLLLKVNQSLSSLISNTLSWTALRNVKYDYNEVFSRDVFQIWIIQQFHGPKGFFLSPILFLQQFLV
jgi:hypothetical protein